MPGSKRRLTRNKLIIASMLAVFLIPVLHGVFFRKSKLTQEPVFPICSEAVAGASEGMEQPGLMRRNEPVAGTNTQPGAVVREEPVVPIKTCPDKGDRFLKPGAGEDLEVTGDCQVTGQVPGGTYWYRNVNIYTKTGTNIGGTLRFEDAVINFHAQSILVENGGSLIAGSASDDAPIGREGGRLTVYLYGKDQGAGGLGIVCKSDPKTCGVPANIWNSNGNAKVPLGNGVEDYFYKYSPLPFDNGTDADGNAGFFGYKVLAVSFGATLQLFGKKGAVTLRRLNENDPGRSWGRLDGTILPGATKLKVDSTVPIDWDKDDHIVVTTTDYLASHSEELVIEEIGDEITFHTACFEDGTCKSKGVQWTHNGAKYSLADADHKGISRLKLDRTSAETRAAVALLTRSIRIVSEADKAMTPFPPAPPFPSATPGYYFGGHTVARQGFKVFQMQGVEFHQLGQGGRLGHYPVHFHMARKVPAGTFVKDSSVNESMTRFYTIHATDGVTLARNVGYLSIGHGYYLEDATETENRLLSNIGIFARAVVKNPQNPRQVPGILTSSKPYVNREANQNVIYNSDTDTPAVFWITNGWNDFIGNMAAGAGLCGACFWEVPANISGGSRSQQWESYASEQRSPLSREDFSHAGISPLKTFDGNFCTSAMTSFQSVGYTQSCPGVGQVVQPIKNDYAPDAQFYCDGAGKDKGKCGELSEDGEKCVIDPKWQVCKNSYYPDIDPGNAHQANRCPNATGSCDLVTEDCRNTDKPNCLCTNENESNCMVSVLNDYTTSFNYSEYNFAAVWLRARWYLFSNSFISDVQNAGLSFVSGGDYTAASSLPGLWELALKSAFVGHTQPQTPEHAYASVLSPFNKDALGLKCDNPDNSSYCMSRDNGFVLGKFTAFANSERLFNIYDGPANQDSNAYLDIKTVTLGDNADRSIYKSFNGIPRDLKTRQCYIPNAAIAWKQSNGFYYPPTFRSRNLFFDQVDIRHYVIEPLFLAGTYRTDSVKAKERYCTEQPTMFDNFTDIDRQTFLTDDDGSLTGYGKTSSINLDAFFAAPVEGPECKSDGGAEGGATARTSPYQYVTTVMFPDCAKMGGTGCGSAWSEDCATPECYGVPLYREYLTGTEDNMNNPPKPEPLKWPPNIRMAGESFFQRSSLTLNHGRYYIDTTTKRGSQGGFPNVNIFEKNQKYDVFLVYGKPATRQTYSFYFGAGLDKKKAEASVELIRVKVPDKKLIIKTVPGSSPILTAAYSDPLMTVSLDLSSLADEYRTTSMNECLPGTFCRWDNSEKKCVGKSPQEVAQPLSQAELDLTCGYAGEDVTCPAGGCIGFQFTLPENFEANDKTPPQASCFPTADNPWNPMLDACGPTTNTSPPCVAAKDIAAECFKAPIAKNFCGMKPGPADMLVKATEGAPLAPNCALGPEPMNEAEAPHVQAATGAMADTGGSLSEARFLDDLSSRQP